MMGNFTKKHRWGVLWTLVLAVISQHLHAQSGSFGSTFAHTTAEMAIYEQHNFVTGSGTINAGIVGSERNPIIGMYSFVNPNGTWINASNTAFMDGYVRTYNTTPFTFPIGDNNRYRPAAVSTSSAAAPTTAAYYGVDPGMATTSNLMGGNYGILPGGGPAFPSTTKAPGVGVVDNVEYWDIDGTTPARITLTWDATTPINAMVGTTLNNLTIVGWDGAKWVAIPSTVDPASLTLTTSASAFTGLAPQVSAGSITTNATVVPGSFIVYTLAGICPPTSVTASITSLTTCSGGEVAINYTTTPAAQTVQWTRMPGNLTNLGNVIDYPTAPGTAPVSYTYTAVVTSAFGCTSNVATTVVTVNPQPILTPSQCSQTICSGETGAITFVTSIPGGVINWVRTPTTPAPSSGTGNIAQSLTNTGPTSLTYTYQIWAEYPASVASCPSSNTITCVIVVENCCNPVVAATSNSPLCSASTLSLSATSGFATYAWSGPNGFVSTMQNPTIPNTTTATSGVYSVTVSDGISCTGLASTTVTIATQPSLSITAGSGLTICSGQSTTLAVAGDGGATVTWVNSLGQSGTSTSIFFAGIGNTNATPETITYVVTASAGNCSDSKIVTLTINPAPVIQVIPVQAVVCALEMTTVTGTALPATATINWTRTPAIPAPASGTGTGSATVNETLPVGTYTYTFTATQNGCTSTPATSQVTVQN
ncbi:hypothetical protein ACS5NO_31970 [Larkinella sp. GY13]|uniref:hypothetical protein n=1 Tax=Larkinella sp. GY13 TaxID=3453720 RepID=UPI003EEFEFF0